MIRLKQHDYKKAVEACNKACELQPSYTKALYRRAQAKRGLKQYESALADCEKAIKATQKLAMELGGGARDEANAAIKEMSRCAEAIQAEGA